MKKLLVAIGLSAAATMPTLAADMPVKGPPQAAVAGAYNWTGLYTASGIGAGWWDVEGRFVAPPVENHNNSSDGNAWYSSHIGFQYQMNNIVVGVEGGYANPLSDERESHVTGSNCQNISLTPDRRCSNSVDRLWTLGGRLGFANGNWMFYGGAGYASARIKADARVASTNVLITRSNEQHDGWYAGGGAEMFLSRFMWSDLIIGIDYKHVELDKDRHVPSVGTEVKDFKGTVDIVTLRAIFKLAPAAVVARN